MFLHIRHIQVFLLVMLFPFWGQRVNASESRGSFVTNYTTDDGLAQNSVRTLFQDSQGFMWMGTWNGLSRFDGYGFQNYFDELPEKYGLRSNRFEQILEDSSGYIWLMSYGGGDVVRLNPVTGNFTVINQLIDPNMPSFHATKIELSSSGDIWLLSENAGCIRISGSDLQCSFYNVQNHQLKSNLVNQLITEDTEKNCWMLTGNGVALIRLGEKEPKLYLSGSNESSEQSFSVALEKAGKIYFGTDKGWLWVYDLKNQTFELASKDFGAPINHLIRGVGNQIVVTTSGNGFFLMEEDTFLNKHYHTKNSMLHSNKITFQFQDSQHNLFVCSNSSYIMRLDLTTGEMSSYEGKSSILPFDVQFLEDQNRNVWIRMKNVDELFLYDSVSHKLVPFVESSLSAGKNYQPITYGIMFDRQGNLWSCGIRGVDKITFFQNKLETILLNKSSSQHANDVRAILEDSHQQLWISTKDGKLWVLGKDGEKKGYLCKNGSVGYGIPLDGIVYSLSETSDGKLWAGTKSHGLYCLTPMGSAYRIQAYLYDATDPYSLSGNSVYALLEDTKNRLWAGTFRGGLNLVERGNGKTRFINGRNHLDYPTHKADMIRCLVEDSQGRICVGTASGLVILDSIQNSGRNIKSRYFYRNESEGNLSSNDIQSICFSGGDMFLATMKGGVNRVVKCDDEGYPLRFKTYTRQNGLSSDITYSVLPDHHGVIWVVSEENIASLNPKTGQIKKYSDIPKIIGNEHFSEGAAYCTRSGKVYFGYTQGLLSFHPEHMTSNAYSPNIVFTDFKAYDKKQSVDSLSTITVDFSYPVTLKHTQNSFYIGFAAIDFASHDNIRYSYRLEGFDPTWIDTKSGRQAYYTNLPKGSYTFSIRSTNSDGVWMENVQQLSIKILPSFWQSNAGVTLIVFFVLLFVVGASALLLFIYKLKIRMRAQQQLSEMKNRLFTDISHEIRTPLTLITGPVEHLLRDPDTPKSVKEQLELVSRNSDRMAKMVNQMLELRKAEHGRLRIEEVVLEQLMEEVASHFRAQAESTQIEFVLDNQTNEATVWVDRDGLEKIMFNLLSNAFKHTPQGKRIRLILQRTATHTLITVEDEGEGISPEHLNHIFERFFSVGDDKNANSGIGLSLVQELVKKHGGEIVVNSELGHGSTFTISLQNGREHYGEEVDFVAQENAKATASDVESLSDTRTTILVVEDDPDLREFLRRILSSQYSVIEAANGKEGFTLAMKHIPDFIVSDVMMPEMDGTQLLQKLKTTLNTSHIPVVLLTAKGLMENKLEGLEYGADDYIVKPFSVPYFKARIKNLLKQRERLQMLYSAKTMEQGAGHNMENIQMGEQDRQFLGTIELDVEKHLGEGDYSIDKLSETLGMSRSVLFKKVKSLTGKAPVDLIRDIRLRNAANLLASKQLMVKEVAYRVGISDIKYFTQCFKKKYGVTPKQYQENLMN